jgi:hypothetical protein
MATIAEIRELLNANNAKLIDMLDAKFDAKIGIRQGETFNDKLNANNAKLIDMFDAKLGIGDGNSVNLPKMERQLHALKSVVPDAVLRGVAPNVVGMGAPSQHVAVLFGSNQQHK